MRYHCLNATLPHYGPRVSRTAFWDCLHHHIDNKEAGHFPSSPRYTKASFSHLRTRQSSSGLEIKGIWILKLTHVPTLNISCSASVPTTIDASLSSKEAHRGFTPRGLGLGWQCHFSTWNHVASGGQLSLRSGWFKASKGLDPINYRGRTPNSLFRRGFQALLLYHHKAKAISQDQFAHLRASIPSNLCILRDVHRPITKAASQATGACPITGPVDNRSIPVPEPRISSWASS